MGEEEVVFRVPIVDATSGGKEVAVKFPNNVLIGGNYCNGESDGSCDRCKLKFKCHTHEMLTLEHEELLGFSRYTKTTIPLEKCIAIYLRNSLEGEER